MSVGVSGSGFTPGELVFAQIPAPGGLAGFAEATVAPDGTVAATIENVFPGGIDPVAEEMKIQIAGVLSQQVLAESSFQITNLAVATKPAVASMIKARINSAPKRARGYGRVIDVMNQAGNRGGWE